MSQTKPRSFTILLALFVTAIALSGCNSQMEPAKKAIGDIEAAVAAAGDDAQHYIPDKLNAVNDQLTILKMKFNQKDYAGVVNAAPPVLAQAQGLVALKNQAIQAEAERVADEKRADQEALKSDWDALSTAAPAAITAAQGRVATLNKAKKLPTGVTKSTLSAAQNDLAEANTLWEQAMSAQSAGNLQDAVTSAKQAKQQADATMASLGA